MVAKMGALEHQLLKNNLNDKGNGDIPRPKRKNTNNKHLLGRVHMHIPHRPHWEQQNDIIRHRIERTTGIQNPCHIHAGPRHGFIPDALARIAEEDLDYAGAAIESDHERDENDDGGVEGAPALRGEYASVED